MLKDYQIKIIELLIKQEILLADLYQALADKFPEHSEFFTKIHNDEINHANWLKKAYYLVNEGKVRFDEGKVKTYTVKAFIEYIEKTINIILQPDTSIMKSLVYCLDIERSPIESKLFSHFTGEDPSLTKIFNQLIEETKKHADEIEQMLKEYRKKN